jgi:hypothetical protein
LKCSFGHIGRLIQSIELGNRSPEPARRFTRMS